MKRKIENVLDAIDRYIKARNRKIKMITRILNHFFYIVVAPAIAYYLMMNQLNYMKGHDESIWLLREILSDGIALAPLVLFCVYGLLLIRSVFRIMSIFIKFIDKRERKVKRLARLNAIRQAKQIEAT